MSTKQFNPSEARDEESESDSGRSMADVLTLPDSEQRFVTWLIRQKQVSLSEAVAYMNQEEEAVCNMLNSLSKQGFVQELNVDGELRYRPCLAPKQGRRASKNLWQALDE